MIIIVHARDYSYPIIYPIIYRLVIYSYFALQKVPMNLENSIIFDK